MPQEIPPISILTDALAGVHLTPQQARALENITRMVIPQDLTVLAQLLRSLRARVRMGAGLLEELAAGRSWDQHVTTAVVEAQGWTPRQGDHYIAVPSLNGDLPRIFPTAITATSTTAACRPVLAYLQEQTGRQAVSVEAYPSTMSLTLGVKGALTGEVELSRGEIYAWMAAFRHHGTVHLLRLEADGVPITQTVCGRSIRTGVAMPLTQAWEKHPIYCGRCDFPYTGIRPSGDAA